MDKNEIVLNIKQLYQECEQLEAKIQKIKLRLMNIFKNL